MQQEPFGAGPRQEFAKTSRPGEFKLKPFTPQSSCAGFQCAVAEYNDYLANDALRSMHDHVALTWLLSERSTGKVAAYMSLIMDAIKLSFTEKELHNLNYPFKTIPAMKIAKLAVDRSFSEKYEGIIAFYQKNGFIPNAEFFNKNRKTISMRKDIYSY
jgi:hypothetical protein